MTAFWIFITIVLAICLISAYVALANVVIWWLLGKEEPLE